MPDQFFYDVFLSHSPKDSEVVRSIAERLRRDGLRVWFREWVIRVGDNTSTKMKEGLKSSRVLVLCMSANAFGVDWPQLESGTFLFRNPSNKERRFVPLRIGQTPIPKSLEHFLFLDWRPEEGEHGYKRLLEACRPSAGLGMRKQLAQRIVRLNYEPRILSYAISPDGVYALSGASDHTMRLWDLTTACCVRVFRGHAGPVDSVIWGSDRGRAISVSSDRTVRVWEVDTGRCIRVLRVKGELGAIAALSSDERKILSGSINGHLRLWDLESGSCLRLFKGHRGKVLSVAWAEDQRRALSGSEDGTMRLWDIETNRCLRVFRGHKGSIFSVVWSADQRWALTGSEDTTLRLWEIKTGRCLRILEGHSDSVNLITWSAVQARVLSASTDQTIRLWNIEAGRCLCVLEGHSEEVVSVVWSADGYHTYSGHSGSTIRVWQLSDVAPKGGAHQEVPVPSSVPAQVQYTNAKVLLVGDSGVGKTGLARYLARGIQDDGRNSSTDGVWATQWILPVSEVQDGMDREIWLWDFAGQVDYRLVHQLFMDDTAAAVLVFNPQNENPFEGLGQWDCDLRKSTRKPFAKLLVAGRIDRGGLVVSRARMEHFLEERAFHPPMHETSAKTGVGCRELCDAIVTAIDWINIPETTSPVLYQRMKQEILHLRDEGMILIRLAELKQRMDFALSGERFKLAELQAVISLLAGPGMIQRLDFGDFILLRPEVLSRYAAAMVRKVRKHPQELGCIREDELLKGDLDYQDFERLPQWGEEIVLRTLLETVVSRAWCFRQPCDNSALLTFPSYFRRERPEQPGHPEVLVTYRFTGPVEDIYATLVVRLHHTEAFEAYELWRFAADFRTQTGESLGLKFTREAEGAARLDIYFAPSVDENSRMVFLRYIHNHLSEQAGDVVRLRHYFCSNRKCIAYGQSFADQAKIDRALATGGRGKLFCPDCGRPIDLRDMVEQKFNSAMVKEQARQMHAEGQSVIDNESRELILVGHAFAIAGEAGQIYRGYTNSDHGIDGEIEFKDDSGRATGKRLYLQLKSGDSYLRKRLRDGAEIFQIKNRRWVTYWQQQAYPVMLVMRNSAGEIRWMDISAYLRRASSSDLPIAQVIFDGERLDVASIRSWRDRVMRGSN